MAMTKGSASLAAWRRGGHHCADVAAWSLCRELTLNDLSSFYDPTPMGQEVYTFIYLFRYMYFTVSRIELGSLTLSHILSPFLKNFEIGSCH